jgi:hypothetical protein
MSDSGNGDELTAAEQRLLTYLEALRSRPPQASDELVTTVLRSARWQALARPYLVATGGMGAALAAAAVALLGSTKRT